MWCFLYGLYRLRILVYHLNCQPHVGVFPDDLIIPTLPSPRAHSATVSRLTVQRTASRMSSRDPNQREADATSIVSRARDMPDSSRPVSRVSGRQQGSPPSSRGTPPNAKGTPPGGLPTPTNARAYDAYDDDKSQSRSPTTTARAFEASAEREKQPSSRESSVHGRTPVTQVRKTPPKRNDLPARTKNKVFHQDIASKSKQSARDRDRSPSYQSRSGKPASPQKPSTSKQFRQSSGGSKWDPVEHHVKPIGTLNDSKTRITGKRSSKWTPDDNTAAGSENLQTDALPDHLYSYTYLSDDSYTDEDSGDDGSKNKKKLW